MYINNITFLELIEQFNKARDGCLSYVIKNPSVSDVELRYWVGKMAAFDEIVNILQKELDKSTLPTSDFSNYFSKN